MNRFLQSIKDSLDKGFTGLRMSGEIASALNPLYNSGLTRRVSVRRKFLRD